MPWQPLPRIAFGVCTYPFQPSSPQELPLQIGDELYIIEQGGKANSWYRGYLVAPPSILAGLTSVKGQTLEARVFSGVFPACCVEIRELLGEDRAELKAQESGVEQQATTTSPKDLASKSSHASLSAASATSPTGPQRSLSGKIRNDVGSETPGIPVSRLSAGRSLRSLHRSSGVDVSQLPPLPPLPTSTTRDPDAPRPPAPVPMLKVGDETQSSLQEPLVDEIASCLREWYNAKLHELLLARRYQDPDGNFFIESLLFKNSKLYENLLFGI
jgi:dedicator of cytokinesis protein 3